MIEHLVFLLEEPSAQDFLELASALGGYQKRDGARRIAPFLQAERNRSSSFQTLMRSLQTLVPK